VSRNCGATIKNLPSERMKGPDQRVKDWREYLVLGYIEVNQKGPRHMDCACSEDISFGYVENLHP
jgi:hypothetical protein